MTGYQQYLPTNINPSQCGGKLFGGTVLPNSAQFDGAPDLEKTYLIQLKVFDFIIQTIVQLGLNSSLKPKSWPKVEH